MSEGKNQKSTEARRWRAEKEEKTAYMNHTLKNRSLTERGRSLHRMNWEGWLATEPVSLTVLPRIVCICSFFFVALRETRSENAKTRTEEIRPTHCIVAWWHDRQDTRTNAHHT